MIQSRRTVLTTVAGLAAAALAAPVLAGDNRKLLQVVDARATAPNFVGITKWFNSAPLSIGDLRGRVVLVDFWTYGCYNCVNTLPYVTRLYETYTGNVQAALKRHGITYPVAQDNESATWNAWRNQYWPAQYIVDQRGNVVFSHAGEGQYDEVEHTIRRLLSATS
jgi:thiol-disulfide isomerase/thioredoxin